MHRSLGLLALCGGFLGGVLYGSVYGIFWYIPYLLMVVSLFCAIFTMGHEKSYRTFLSKTVWVAPFILFGFGFGILRISGELSKVNEFLPWQGQKQDFEAVLVQEPDVRENTQLLTVRPVGYRQKILITTTKFNLYSYGDLIWVRGKVVAAEEFDGFDYPGYLAQKGVFALVRYPKIIVLKSSRGNFILANIYKLKRFLSVQARRYYEEPKASFVLGLVIGERRGLPKDVTEHFARTGTSHIMAVSGFNIAILIAALAGLAGIFGRRLANILSFFIVSVFVLLVGFSGSVLRAAGMGYVVLVAMTGQRLYFPLQAMLVVAGIMTLLSPRIVYWDVGFQLSVAATTGIILFMPYVKWMWNTKLKAAIFGPAAVTMAATIATLPISIWQFEQFSLISPFVNVLIAFAVPVAMALGALSFLPFVGPGFAYINSWVLGYILNTVEYFSKADFAVQAYILPGRTVVVIYLVLFLVMLILSRVSSKKRFGLNLPL